MNGTAIVTVRRLALAGAAVTAVSAVSALPAAAATPAPMTTSCGTACVAFTPTAEISTGAADAAAPLNAALAATPAGTTFTLPAGTYRVARPVQVPSGVTVAGAGMDSTRLLLDRRAWTNFGYSFVITPAPNSVNATVLDLTVDGNRIAVDTVGKIYNPAANQGGGVKAGSGWTVQRVRLSNINYFKLWVNNATGVKFLDNRFEDLGAGKSGGNDNIGGGNSRDVLIKGNVFTNRSVGNSVDIVLSSQLTIEGNTVEGTPTAPHNLYLEGVTDSVVARNTMKSSSISVQSNANYADHTVVINPRGIKVLDNVVDSPAVQGISVRYDITRGTTATGGDNTISGNRVIRAGTAGIITLAAAEGLATSPDRISGNTVIDAFTRGTTSWNCGYGTTQAAGIVVGVGAPVTEVGGNKVVATTSPATTAVGVQYGLSSSRKVKVTTSTATPNTVEGVAKVEVRI